MTRSLLAAVLSTGLLAACGSSSNDSTPPPPPVSLDCTTYCNQMGATCTAAGEVQYTGLTGTCSSYCGTTNAWPAGTAGAASGNSLACRLTHAGLAAAEASGSTARALHCGHAGPTGGSTCGTLCENYCFLALKNCTGANAAGLGFTDNATCLAACAAFPTNGAVNTGGNTVQCRIYHAGAAAATPSPHCGHAQVISSATVGGTTANGPCN